MKTYFNRPTQVMFADPDNAGEWIVGIAYKDEIICACCGGAFGITEIIKQAQEDGVKQQVRNAVQSCAKITGGPGFPRQPAI